MIEEIRQRNDTLYSVEYQAPLIEMISRVDLLRAVHFDIAALLREIKRQQDRITVLEATLEKLDKRFGSVLLEEDSSDPWGEETKPRRNWCAAVLNRKWDEPEPDIAAEWQRIAKEYKQRHRCRCAFQTDSRPCWVCEDSNLIAAGKPLPE